jgi:hypothetical protein
VPRPGIRTSQALASGATLVVDTSSAPTRRQSQPPRHEAVPQRQTLFNNLGIDAIEIRTDEPYLNPLMRFFRKREQKR